jgi:hypothetical protein
METLTTLNTLTKKKKITNRVLIVLMVILIAMMIHDLIVKNQFFFLIVEIMMLGASIDYMWRNVAAFPVISFTDDCLELSRGERRVTIPYDVIASLSEIKNGFIAIVVDGKTRFFVHGEHGGSMARDAAERTSNIIRDTIKERTGKEIPIKYL